MSEREPAHHPRSARWRSPLAIVLMLLTTVGVAIPAVVQLTPAVETTVAGQYLGVGASTPTGGWVGDLDEIVDDGPASWPRAVRDGFTGPAQLEQIGNTTIDLARIQVRGPLRPRLELGPLVHTSEADDLVDPETGEAARDDAVDAVASGFRTWFVHASLLLLLATVGVIAVFSAVRLWRTLSFATRRHGHLSVAEVWGRHARRLVRDGLVVLLGTAVAWAGVGMLALDDTQDGLATITSPSDLVGTDPVEVEPQGPAVQGYTGVVLGDSRASRLGGPPVADPDRDEEACQRSSDSLAAQLTRLSAEDEVLNLACPSATIDAGILGSQRVGDVTVPAQMSRLLRVEDPRFVVLMIGPNDLAWTDFLRYCYGVEECDDRFTSGQFDYRLAAFDRSYGDLLGQLAALPGEPQVVVVGSYDVFQPDADCADTEGPEGVPGLDAEGISLLAERTDRYNEVITAGAEAYDFDVTIPRLETLCQPEDPEVGADLQGLDDQAPFHPTGVGMVRLGAAVYAEIDPPEAEDEPSALD